MNIELINKWNKVITNNDTVYHLGDFFWSCTWDEVIKIIDSLNFKTLKIIPGNHDTQRILKMLSAWYNSPNNRNIIIEPQLKDISINRQHITLCHYMMNRWNKIQKGSWQLFGHSHGGISNCLNQMDVGVDTNNYCPYSFEDIKNIMKAPIETS